MMLFAGVLEIPCRIANGFLTDRHIILYPVSVSLLSVYSVLDLCLFSVQFSQEQQVSLQLINKYLQKRSNKSALNDCAIIQICCLSLHKLQASLSNEKNNQFYLSSLADYSHVDNTFKLKFLLKVSPNYLPKCQKESNYISTTLFTLRLEKNTPFL